MSEPDGCTEDDWQTEWLNAVFVFAEHLKDLDQRNPWPETPFLPQAIIYLMTELWDRGYSQSQIRDACEAAVSDMPRYAAGSEVRD